MSQHAYSARRVVRALTGLDFGLRVRVDPHRSQRTIFSGADNFSVQDLTSELTETISLLRVYRYSVRGQLEQLTYALQVNVECGFWSLARRAALDLSAVLTQAKKRRVADAGCCVHAANAALRIAELCSKEVQ